MSRSSFKKAKKYSKNIISSALFLLIFIPSLLSAAATASSWDGPTPTGPGQYDSNGNFILNFDNGSKTVTSPDGANGNHTVTNYDSSGNQIYTQTLGANGLQTGYGSLAPLPNVSNASSNDLSSYLKNVFILGIGIATGLAVIMIVIGGIQYMSTDAISGKTEGREKIASALWGLLIALASYVILNTINPKLLSTELQIPTTNGTIQNVNITPYNTSIGGAGGFNGLGSSGGSGGLSFSDPSLYTGYNGSPIDSYYQDNMGNMVFNYDNGTQIIQYWDNNGPTGQGELYNSNGERIINGQVVSYIDYTTNPNTNTNDPVYHFADGSSYVQYVDANNNQIAGGEFYNSDGDRVINGRASDYQYYDGNGDLVIHYTDGTETLADSSMEQAIISSPYGDSHQAPTGSNIAINQTVAGLRAAGITNPNAIAAILGHTQQESNWQGNLIDTSADHGTGADGIFQVGNPVWNNYLGSLKDPSSPIYGYDVGSQYAQAYYMATAFQKVQPADFNSFQNATTPTDALNAWGQWNNWGIIGGRFNYANQFINRYQTSGGWGG